MDTNIEFSLAPSFFGLEELSLLRLNFNRAFDDTDATYLHANVVQFNREKVVASEVLSGVCRKIEAHFSEELGVSDVSLEKIWMVKSQPKDTDPTKLPYIPHFDKHRYLKAMIYLHDVDINHGPIYFGKLLYPAQIDVRRRKLPPNYKEIGGNTIKASELKSGMDPVLGKGGDVVFFDTNAAHCAGIVNEGFERHVIRFDFDVRGFDPSQSLVKRLGRFISSLIS